MKNIFLRPVRWGRMDEARPLDEALLALAASRLYRLDSQLRVLLGTLAERASEKSAQLAKRRRAEASLAEWVDRRDAAGELRCGELHSFDHVLDDVYLKNKFIEDSTEQIGRFLSPEELRQRIRLEGKIWLENSPDKGETVSLEDSQTHSDAPGGCWVSFDDGGFCGGCSCHLGHAPCAHCMGVDPDGTGDRS